MERNSFTFYLSFEKAIEHLTDADQLLLYRAISRFSLFGEEPTLSGFAAMGWELIKPILEKSRVKSANGSKAKGIAKPSLMGNDNAKTKQNQNENEAKSKQDRERDRDRDKTISNDIVGIGGTDVPAHSQDYLNFQKWLSVNCPDIWKGFKSTLTEQEFNKLLESHTKQEIADMTLDMENNKSFVRNHKDLYRSLLTWFRNAERWKGGNK